MKRLPLLPPGEYTATILSSRKVRNKPALRVKLSVEGQVVQQILPYLKGPSS